MADDSEEEDDFERDTRSEPKKLHDYGQSPIHDDSEILRGERDNYLSSFMQQRRNSVSMTNRSEKMPQLDDNFAKAYVPSEVSPHRAIQVGGGNTSAASSHSELSPAKRWVADRT